MSPDSLPRVAVVGASAAGLLTASRLADQGHEVRVYERARALDPEPRTLIVTSRFRDELGELAEPSIVNEIDTFELYANGRVAQVPLDRPDLIIERAVLIRTLADHARDRGVELRLGHEFEEIHPRGSGVELRFRVRTAQASPSRGGPPPETAGDGGSAAVAGGSTATVGDAAAVVLDSTATVGESADVVVGADGAFSAVAEASGWERQPTLPLVQAIVTLPEDMAPSDSRVWFLPDETPYFYWLIPETDTTGALGIIGEDPSAVRAHLEGFLDRHGLQVHEFQGARIPCYVKWIPVHRRVGEADVYLVGDAAGQVKVTTVGGIVTGLRGALGVAETIASGSRRTLRSLRRELDFHLLIRRALHHFEEEDYDRLLQLLSSGVKESLGKHTRDETGRLLGSVLFRQPRLAWMGLKGLVSGGSFGAPAAADSSS